MPVLRRRARLTNTGLRLNQPHAPAVFRRFQATAIPQLWINIKGHFSHWNMLKTHGDDVQNRITSLTLHDILVFKKISNLTFLRWLSSCLLYKTRGLNPT